MKAIILAAGKATRLLPLTKDTPQSMLKVGKKTILERQIDLIKKSGINEITVITGYLSEKLEKHCESLGIRTLFNPFYTVSGIALTLWVAKDELKEDFVLLYSDVLFDPEIINGLFKSKGDICLAIKKDGLRDEAEKVVEMGSIITKVSKVRVNEANGEFIGITRFSKRGAKKLRKELNNVARVGLHASLIEVIDNLIRNKETVSAYDIKNAQFIDIDFPDGLKKAKKVFG